MINIKIKPTTPLKGGDLIIYIKEGRVKSKRIKTHLDIENAYNIKGAYLVKPDNFQLHKYK